MTVWKERDYSNIDLPGINSVLFYPRKDDFHLESNQTMESVMIPVGEGHGVSSLWTKVNKKSTTSILFFHGNGELASEYVDIAGIFLQMDVRFICVDYRGYGSSSGNPGIGEMIRDAHDIFRYVFSRINKEEKLIIMGRSLGCVSALEIAAMYGEQIAALIIESGFAETLPLLKSLGADVEFLQIKEEDGFANKEKIKEFRKNLLIIHGENDYLIPLSQARQLFAASDSSRKKFLEIPSAGHNDIFYIGLRDYLSSINDLVKQIAG